MRLLLIRHAESLANAEGRLQGHMDFSLSERGREQAVRIAERLAEAGIDALYTSPLSRAKETAAVLAQRLGLEAFERSGLVERNVGELAGLTRDEIIARYPHYLPARTALRPIEIPGFEQDADFVARVDTVLSSIIEVHPGESAAVVTHGGVIFSFCRQTLQIPTLRPGPFRVDNASITTFDIAEGEFRPVRTRVQLVSLNDTCHLDRA